MEHPSNSREDSLKELEEGEIITDEELIQRRLRARRLSNPASSVNSSLSKVASPPLPLSSTTPPTNYITLSVITLAQGTKQITVKSTDTVHQLKEQVLQIFINYPGLPRKTSALFPVITGGMFISVHFIVLGYKRTLYHSYNGPFIYLFLRGIITIDYHWKNGIRVLILFVSSLQY